MQMRIRAATNMKLLARNSFSPISSIGLLTLLLPIFLVLSQQSFAISNPINFTRYNGQVSSLMLARIQRHLDKINKQSLFTIKSPDGDIIDCIDIEKQPAFKNPLLKKHKIQRVPPNMPKSVHGVRGTKHRNTTALGIRQKWHESGKRCPKGTIPIRRSSGHGKKQSKYMPPNGLSDNGHEHAIAYTKSLGSYGAKATINVWSPDVEMRSELSLAQIWVVGGPLDGDLNSIEAGWQVSPQLYGDSLTRLFIYWTKDAYKDTGCYNLMCPGFIQTNSEIVLGGTISPVSSFGGKQFDITILIWKDPHTGNWWLGYGDNIAVGYWPTQLFTYLADKATTIEWGGEVVNSRPQGVHTKTQMGSGHFAEEGFEKASYFRKLEVVNSDNNTLTPACNVSTLVTATNCYNINSSYHDDEWGSYFFYGGPGNNPNCP